MVKADGETARDVIAFVNTAEEYVRDVEENGDGSRAVKKVPLSLASWSLLRQRRESLVTQSGGGCSRVGTCASTFFDHVQEFEAIVAEGFASVPAARSAKQSLQWAIDPPIELVMWVPLLNFALWHFVRGFTKRWRLLGCESVGRKKRVLLEAPNKKNL